jgi:TusA-related sulfurtransferase
MKTIDAYGISCPEPLIMLKNALTHEKEILLLVDSKCAIENCTTYAKKKGYTVNITTDDNDKNKYKIHITVTK